MTFLKVVSFYRSYKRNGREGKCSQLCSHTIRIRWKFRRPNWWQQIPWGSQIYYGDDKEGSIYWQLIDVKRKPIVYQVRA